MGRKLPTIRDFLVKKKEKKLEVEAEIVCSCATLTGRSNTSRLMEKQAAHFTVLPFDVFSATCIMID